MRSCPCILALLQGANALLCMSKLLTTCECSSNSPQLNYNSTRWRSRALDMTQHLMMLDSVARFAPLARSSALLSIQCKCVPEFNWRWLILIATWTLRCAGICIRISLFSHFTRPLVLIQRELCSYGSIKPRLFIAGSCVLLMFATEKHTKRRHLRNGTTSRFT